MPVTLGQKSPAAVGSFVHVAQPRFLIKHFFRIFGRHVEGKRNWSHPLSPTSRVTVQLPVELRNWYSDGCIYIYIIYIWCCRYNICFFYYPSGSVEKQTGPGTCSSEQFLARSRQSPRIVSGNTNAACVMIGDKAVRSVASFSGWWFHLFFLEFSAPDSWGRNDWNFDPIWSNLIQFDYICGLKFWFNMIQFSCFKWVEPTTSFFSVGPFSGLEFADWKQKRWPVFQATAIGDYWPTYLGLLWV